jgi:predicted SprT family Zn-dependent metalloprotease
MFSKAQELKLVYVHVVADTLLQEFKLAERGWIFDYNYRVRDFGLCKYPKNRRIKGGIIELSAPFVILNDFDLIHEVLLHEIAHALTGPFHMHDTKWKATAKSIGAKPERLIYDAVMPRYKYRATCEKCKNLFYRYRQVAYNRSVYCPYCGKKYTLCFERYTSYA